MLHAFILLKLNSSKQGVEGGGHDECSWKEAINSIAGIC